MFEKKVILDTCGLLWLSSGGKKLSRKALEAIDNASLVLVSAISAWEISLKAEQGSLILPLAFDSWFEKVVSHHNVTVAPLDVEILVAANRLPWHHHDPADRFIIATALRENAPVVTGDKRFELYGVKVIA
jgi:PIN domain nuclease of toxin-antitoxin system